MDTHQIKQHLTDLVLDGREEVVIEELLAISHSSNTEIRNNITSLSTRYQKFERDMLGGTLSKERINNTSDRISRALLVIIEQLTEENEGDQQANELAAIFTEIDELSATGNLLSTDRARTVKKFLIIVPLGILLVVGILAFNGIFSKTTNPGTSALVHWGGVWNHQMQSTGDNKITGTLTFEIVNENEFVGKANNVYPDGSETTNTLSQIEFSGNGKVIEGIWRTDNVQSLYGTFKFSLDGDDRFEGHYTVGNQEGEYYWNGTK